MFCAVREVEREVVPDEFPVPPQFDFMYNADDQSLLQHSDASVGSPVGGLQSDNLHSLKREQEALRDSRDAVVYGKARGDRAVQQVTTTAPRNVSAYPNEAVEEAGAVSFVDEEKPFATAPHDEIDDDGQRREDILPQKPIVTYKCNNKVKLHDVDLSENDDQKLDANKDEALAKQSLESATGNGSTSREESELSTKDFLRLLAIDVHEEVFAARSGMIFFPKAVTPLGSGAMACKFCAASEELRPRMRVYCWPYLIDQIWRHLWKDHDEEWQKFKRLEEEHRETFFEGRLPPRRVIEDRVELVECVWVGEVGEDAKKKFGMAALWRERLRLQEDEGEEGKDFRRWKLERRAARSLLRKRKRVIEEEGEEKNQRVEKRRRVEIDEM